jgi:hypothetical protein
MYWTQSCCRQFVKLGEAVGIIAAQSVARAGTQLAMDISHWWYPPAGLSSNRYQGEGDGVIQRSAKKCRRSTAADRFEQERLDPACTPEGAAGYNVVIGSMISKDDGTLVRGKPSCNGTYNVPILTPAGRQDRIPRHDRWRDDQA